MGIKYKHGRDKQGCCCAGMSGMYISNCPDKKVCKKNKEGPFEINDYPRQRKILNDN